MTATSIPAPRSEYTRHKNTRSKFELAAWLFMRISGLLLVFLIFGHLFVNLWSGEGVQGLDFGFVAGKWANPFWQIWDLAMLWLAMIHGTNGLRTIINDYAEKPGTNVVLQLVLYIASAIVVVLGTMVIFTFDPCPANTAAELLPKFCTA